MTAADVAPGAVSAPASARLEISVTIAPGALAAFQRASGAGAESAGVPLTYPFCWLTLPEVRPVLAGMIGAGVLPVHEGQSFDFERPLEPSADYRVVFVFTRTHGPERLVVAAEASTSDGAPAARFETVLRLVPAQGA